jgi:hypothetical protein
MASRIRIVILCVLLIIVCHLFPQVRHAESDVADRFDKRPAVDILFIGNSRTFFHDMPFMVRKIADSAHSPRKYRIAMHAPGGVRLQDHWFSPKVQELLQRKWDYVVLQGRSNEQLYPSLNSSFETYGKKLADAIEAGGAVPVLFVTWRYADDDPLFKSMPELKDKLHGQIQEGYSDLAKATGAQMVNVGRVWEKLRVSAPQMPLYYDTNHPSIYGSYLCALMFYRFFSGDDLANVTYVPAGISPEYAALLKTAAQSW